MFTCAFNFNGSFGFVETGVDEDLSEFKNSLAVLILNLYNSF